MRITFYGAAEEVTGTCFHVIFKDGTEFKGKLGGFRLSSPGIYMRFLKIRLSYNDEEKVLDMHDVKSIFFGW